MSQTLSKVYIHAIFSTKDREPLIAEGWREEMFHVIGGTTNNLGCQSLIVGGMSDHVHILFQLSRTITLADTMSKIKSMSSLWVNQTRGLPVRFQWQGGYSAFSISQSNVESVREYIRGQESHHATKSYQEELREWLRRYELEWDERYLWN